MIAIRKSHRPSESSVRRGDLFEIILIQVKGGTAKFPSPEEIARLVYVKDHHRADKVVLAEWKRGERMCCYLLPDTTNAVPAAEIFGNVPNTKRRSVKAQVALPPNPSLHPKCYSGLRTLAHSGELKRSTRGSQR
jgi:hypothetical protein